MTPAVPCKPSQSRQVPSPPNVKDNSAVFCCGECQWSYSLSMGVKPDAAPTTTAAGRPHKGGTNV